jgi:hypothetical protein
MCYLEDLLIFVLVLILVLSVTKFVIYSERLFLYLPGYLPTMCAKYGKPVHPHTLMLTCNMLGKSKLFETKNGSYGVLYYRSTIDMDINVHWIQC